MSRALNEVDVAVLDVERPRWIGSYRGFCHAALEALGVRSSEVSVLVTGDARMRELNRRYRGADRTTDVLSFCQEEPRGGARREPLGDIVISLQAMERNAARFGVPPDQEIKRLTIHGLLHLRGWDHRTLPERSRMHALEEALLAKCGKEKVLP